VPTRLRGVFVRTRIDARCCRPECRGDGNDAPNVDDRAGLCGLHVRCMRQVLWFALRFDGLGSLCDGLSTRRSWPACGSGRIVSRQFREQLRPTVGRPVPGVAANAQFPAAEILTPVRTQGASSSGQISCGYFVDSCCRAPDASRPEFPELAPMSPPPPRALCFSTSIPSPGELT